MPRPSQFDRGISTLDSGAESPRSDRSTDELLRPCFPTKGAAADPAQGAPRAGS